MRRLLPPLCAALVIGLSGCLGGTSTESGAGFVSGSGTVDVPAQEREPAPEVTGETLDGTTLSLAELDGIVVVNFWASWCGPCAGEAPDLVVTHERFADRGAQLVGVNVRDSLTNARSFERDFDVPYPSLYDDDQSIAAAFGGIGASALPTTIIIDAQGRVAARLFGQVSETQLSSRLESLIEESAARGPEGGGRG